LMTAVACALLGACRRGDPYAGFSADELRDAGLAKMDVGKEDEARELFEAMIAHSPTVAAEGLYLIGKSYYQQRLYDEAYARFEQLIDRYPASEWCDDAQYMKGQARLEGALPLDKDQTDVDEALDEFLTLIEDYENSELVPRAQEGIAKCRRLKAAKLFKVAQFYKKTGEYRAATVYLGNIADDYPEFDRLAEVYYLNGLCHQALAEPSEAATSFKAVVAKYPDSPLARDAAAKLAALKNETP
jgi:outer membrane protein assembly factor BamD